MAWDGGGNFNRTNGVNTGETVWQDDAASGVKIRADRHDVHDEDLADGIHACLAKNGENVATLIQLGATDTTLTRSAAGILAVEGVDQVNLSSAQTLTNKTLTSPVIDGGTIGATTPPSSIVSQFLRAKKAGTPAIFLEQTDAAVDEKKYRLVASGGQLDLDLLSDDELSEGGVFIVNRTGMTVDSFDILASTTTAKLLAITDRLSITHANPVLALIETGVATDEARWRMMADSTRFSMSAMNDVEAVITDFLQVDRTTTTVDKINLLATDLQYNSVAVPTISSTHTLTNKDCSSATNTFPAASETATGDVELATTTEASAGTDTARATTAAGVQQFWDDRVSTGTYTGTATGMTTSPTVTVYYMIIGNLVHIETKVALSGTSNSTAFTIIGGPAAVRPLTNSGYFIVEAKDNGADVVAKGYMDNAGIISLTETNGGAWVTSGTKRVNRFTASYRKDI